MTLLITLKNIYVMSYLSVISKVIMSKVFLSKVILSKGILSKGILSIVNIVKKSSIKKFC